MNTIRVLLADDDAIYVAGLRLLLENEGGVFIVDEATDSDEILHKAITLQPDVVVMNLDFLASGTSSLIRELCRKINNVRVLGMGRDTDPAQIIEALNAGMSGYLPRHAQPTDLFRAVRAVHDDGAFLYPSLARVIIENYLRQTELGSHEATPSHGLSVREAEVLKLIGRGFTSRQIADYLCLSIKTVERHTANIMEKLDVHRRTELVRYTIRKGMVDLR